MAATTHPPLKPSPGAQRAIGLALTAGILGSWLFIHIFGLFVFELTWTTLPLALLMGLAQCWLSVGLFIVSHDAMHGSLVPGSKRLNGFIGGTLLFLYAGFGWRKMRDAHYDHHAHAGSERDPDFDADAPHDARRWYTSFLKRYFGWRSVLFVSTVVTVYWLVFGVPMAQIVLLYGAPAIASSMQLFYFGTFRPHRHAHDSFIDRHNARTDGFPGWLSLLTCFHFGYHLEHHRRPDLPWWALPAARKAGVGA